MKAKQDGKGIDEYIDTNPDTGGRRLRFTNLIADKNKELARLREELRLAKMACEAAQEQTAALHNTEGKEMKRLREQFTTLQQNAVGIQKENKRLREENERLREENEELRSRIAAETARADAMRSAHAKDALSLEQRG